MFYRYAGGALLLTHLFLSTLAAAQAVETLDVKTCWLSYKEYLPKEKPQKEALTNVFKNMKALCKPKMLRTYEALEHFYPNGQEAATFLKKLAENEKIQESMYRKLMHYQAIFRLRDESKLTASAVLCLEMTLRNDIAKYFLRDVGDKGLGNTWKVKELISTPASSNGQQDPIFDKDAPVGALLIFDMPFGADSTSVIAQKRTK